MPNAYSPCNLPRKLIDECSKFDHVRIRCVSCSRHHPTAILDLIDNPHIIFDCCGIKLHFEPYYLYYYIFKMKTGRDIRGQRCRNGDMLVDWIDQQAVYRELGIK